MLLRYGKDAWRAKDGRRRSRTVNALVFDADGNASAEVWLLGGDATVYTSPVPRRDHEVPPRSPAPTSCPPSFPKKVSG
ncbi:MAG: hypothetical protein R2683_04230 [Bifidobacterium adolescentis]